MDTIGGRLRVDGYTHAHTHIHTHMHTNGVVLYLRRLLAFVKARWIRLVVDSMLTDTHMHAHTRTHIHTHTHTHTHAHKWCGALSPYVVSIC